MFFMVAVEIQQFAQKVVLHTPEDDGYLALVRSLCTEFDRALGSSSSPIERLQRAYHPALERARIMAERHQHGDKSPLLPGLKREIKQNLITTLMERYHVRGGNGYLQFDGGQLWSEDYPVEPFLEVLKRGAALRKSLGSPDQFREQAEIDGWEKISKNLLTSPAGTKIISLSPPSKEPGSPYSENYIDEFTLVYPNGQEKVLRRRTAVEFSLEEYQAFALEATPNYFNQYYGGPEDAYSLSHPIVSPKEIPPNRISGFAPEKFDLIAAACASAIDTHVDALFSRDADWVFIAQSLNRLFDQADKIHHRLETNGRISPAISTYGSGYADGPISLVSGGCGISGGFRINLLNSVAEYGVSEKPWSYHLGDCVHPGCGAKDVEVGPCYICKKCEKLYD